MFVSGRSRVGECVEAVRALCLCVEGPCVTNTVPQVQDEHFAAAPAIDTPEAKLVCEHPENKARHAPFAPDHTYLG